MRTFKCGGCKEQIIATKENTEGIVYFDGKYWHKDCFVAMCDKKIASGRSKKYNWREVLDDIAALQNVAAKSLKLAAEKDDVYNFIVDNYNISCTNSTFFTRLQSVYDGSYVGLLYPISPVELLAEWEYYMPELKEGRKLRGMTDAQAVPYDLAILLGRNAEYREIMEKRKVEERVKKAHKSTEVEVDLSEIHKPNNISRGSRRLANLYEEFIGGENNG